MTAQELPSANVLPLALASEAAATALAACEARGYRVSVAVVDRAGLLKVLMRGDGAGPHTLDSSSRKAYTSLTLRHSTSELVELIQNNPSVFGLRDMNEKILILGGGLPIKAGEEFIGGIGVGGAPGADKDEACALADVMNDPLVRLVMRRDSLTPDQVWSVVNAARRRLKRTPETAG